MHKELTADHSQCQPQSQAKSNCENPFRRGVAGCAAASPASPAFTPTLRLTFRQRTVLVPERWRLTPKSSVRSPNACHCAGTLSLRATSASRTVEVVTDPKRMRFCSHVLIHK